MSDSSTTFPSREEGLRLHFRLCDLDPLAPADVCAAYLGPLAACLQRAFPTVDPHLCLSAVHEALMAYVRDPRAYDPGRRDLALYLRMSARGDLRNLRRGEDRHQRGRVPWSVVELGQEAGNICGRDEEPSLALERGEQAEECRAFLGSVCEGLSAEERLVFELMLAGEHATPVFARALDLGDRPAAEQERAVKRVKDRIKKRLERGGDKHG